MNKRIYFLGVWLLGLLLSLPSQAQYASPAPLQDGSISAGEYNNNVFFPTKTITEDSGGAWYMTWDAQNLYVAKTGDLGYLPHIMYLDLDPILPVTGGGVDKGILTGNQNGGGDYGVIPSLPFRGDARVYFSDTYVEVRLRQSNGTWGDAITTNLSVSNTGSNRELKLSWATLTGGGTIPPAFNWLGYKINQSAGTANVRSDQAPANPAALGTAGGTTPPLNYYFTVISTANGSATNPFLLRSFTYLSNQSDNAFGEISVWDFTMNKPDVQISRGTTRGNWTISGSLVVGGGSVFFGNSANEADFGTTNVGNVRVLGNGILSMNQTPNPLNVREDVDLTGGSQFLLSGREGGDLNVGRNFFVTNGMTSPATFQNNTRAVTFTGSGVSHLIQANNGYVIPFAFLILNSPGGSVILNSSIAVGSQLTFGNGLLYTGSNYVQLDGASSLASETVTSHIIGNTRISQTLGTNGSGTKAFGNIGLTLTPQGASAARGETIVTRVTGTTLAGVGIGSGGISIQRYFVVTGGNSAAALDLILQFAFRADETNGIPNNRLSLYKSETGAPNTFTRLTAPSAATNSNQPISYNYTGALTSGTYFTLADGATPLPVTLTSFTAQATAQGTALLRWTTAREVNCKGFGIERQLGGGSDWQPVGYVMAANYATGSGYSFTDKSLASAPASAQAYYRLRQEDLDGITSYSPVAVIARSATADATALVLSPVPVTGASLSLTFAEVQQAGSEVTITNVQGQRMAHFTTTTSTDEALSLPVDNLAAGVYIVSVQVPGQAVRHARFVKQ